MHQNLKKYKDKSMTRFFSFIIAIFVVIGVVFIFYHFSGTRLDVFKTWIEVTLSALWLLFIVTIPWNTYFKAKEIMFEADISQKKNIKIVEENLQFSQRVAKRSFFMAVLLHVLSSVGLFYLAYTGVSMIGYYTATLSILLTFLRPSIRLYEYIHKRLNSISEEFRYPREDIEKVLNDLSWLMDRVKYLENELNNEEGSGSWRLSVEKFQSKTKENIQKMEDLVHQIRREDKNRIDEVKQSIEIDIEKVRKESQEIISKIVENNQIVESIGTIAKFIKKL